MDIVHHNKIWAATHPPSHLPRRNIKRRSPKSWISGNQNPELAVKTWPYKIRDHTQPRRDRRKLWGWQKGFPLSFRRPPPSYHDWCFLTESQILDILKALGIGRQGTRCFFRLNYIPGGGLQDPCGLLLCGVEERARSGKARKQK